MNKVSGKLRWVAILLLIPGVVIFFAEDGSLVYQTARNIFVAIAVLSVVAQILTLVFLFDARSLEEAVSLLDDGAVSDAENRARLTVSYNLQRLLSFFFRS